ncbi:MAG: DamX protein [Marinobacter psychrophilus]|jgi:DamX protein
MVNDDNLNSQEAGGLFPRLQERFGLRADPSAMEAPFFTGAQRQSALESLRQMSGFGDMAVLVSAPSGLGKTRLLAELVRSESSRLEFHRLGSAALGSPQALVRDLSIVARCLDLEAGPKAALSQFFKWSEQRAGKGQRMVLLIDNAEQAPAELLNLLFNGFLGANRSLAALPVFAGTEALPGMMELAQQASGTVHQITLAPLNRDELAEYLQPRVKLAGGNAGELLSPDRLKQIYTRSLGNFCAIQRITPTVWLDMAVRAAPTRHRAKMPWRTLGWPLLALVLLAASWWFVSRQYDTVMSGEDASAQTQTLEPMRKSITVGPEVAPGQGAVAQPASSMALGAPEPVVATDDSEPKFDRKPVIQPESMAQSISRSGNQLTTSEGSIAGGDTTRKQVIDNPEPEPATVVEPELEPEVVSKAQPVPSPRTAVEAVPAQVDFTPAKLDRFVPLLQRRSSGGWTIQLVAGNLEQTALNILRRYPQVDAMVYTRGERNGRQWFMVFQGIYPSKDAAQQAVQTLPAGLVSGKPWVRENRSL